MARTVRDLLRELSGTDADDSVLARLASSPADTFAATSAILGESGAYRLVVSPPDGREWPPEDPVEWRRRVGTERSAWLAWCDAAASDRAKRVVRAQPPSPATVLVAKGVADILDVGLHALGAHGTGAIEWERVCHLLHLHAVADEACAGLGLSPNPAAPVYGFEVNSKLSDTGSASSFPEDRVRVVPKLRTPQAGISLRSLSHHASLSRCEVDVRWRRFENPTRRSDRLRVLLFPWPFVVDETAFVEVDGPLRNLDTGKFGFFDFRPAYDSNELMRQFEQVLKGASDHTGAADAVVLPETAVTPDEFDKLWDVCKRQDVKVLLAGVRAPGRNEARLRIGDGPEKLFVQHKHHRWCLDEGQIRAYGIGSALNPVRRWWEATSLRPRRLSFVAFSEWLTICHLICEDLARTDPVAQVVRAIGPTLLVALLSDGPQLSKRWSARYATVLADDPGTSVLTLTSLGMAERSRPTPGDPPNRTIALWRDAKDGLREIALDPGALGVLLTLWPDWMEEFTADGRADGAAAGRVILGGIRQVL